MTPLLKVLEALFALGLGHRDVQRLQEIADREWSGDLAALCAYILRDYVPAEVLEYDEDES